MKLPSLPNLSPAAITIFLEKSIQLLDGPKVRIGTASCGVEGLGFGMKRWLDLFLFWVLGGPVIFEKRTLED